MPMTGSGKPSPEEISLYFHIPFCTKKCPYCHFFVLPDQSDLKESFLQALELEWRMHLPKIIHKKVVSIYFGGGTPSLLGARSLEKILHWITSSPVTLAEDCEITLEVNPENASLPLMRSFKEIGINRISLGVQSLDSSLLNTLERTHSAKQSIAAIENTVHAGLNNLSIDLMFELPNQTLVSWERTLLEIKNLPITHLSLYNLVIEPHTVFYKRKKELTPTLPSSQTSLAMLEKAVFHLENFGLKRYEVSAFAKQGHESRHNTGYWLGRSFLGLGPSAFSYWDKKRFRNVANLSRYKKALESHLSAVDFEECLPFPENIQELLAVELRLLKGVDLNLFQAKHQMELPSHIPSVLEELEKKGWLIQKDHTIRLSHEGLLFYDSVATTLI